MSKEKKYSEWEYDEGEGKTDPGPADPGKAGADPNDPNAGGEPATPTMPSDDTEIEVDGEKMTLGEFKKEFKEGTMRQSDYTRKTQELAEERKRLSEPPAPKSGEDEFDPEDEKAADLLVKIAKKRHGLMTREEYEREREAEKFGTDLNSTIGKWNKNPELPKITDTELIEFMKESNIHNPEVALREMFKDEWLNYEIAQRAKGKKGYSAEKQGEKIPPKKKTYNLNTDEGMKDMIKDELNIIKENK